MKRRDFLKGFFAAPFAVSLRPATAAPHRLMPGDLVDYVRPWRETGFIGARIVASVSPDGSEVGVHNGSYGIYKAVETFKTENLKLFEGLPGNRVDNPSMRHRLIRTPGRLGLRYAED